MNSTNLPPLPTPEQRSSEVCARMALYIAVWQDLTPTQKALASRHIQICETCEQEYHLINGATKMVARLSQESTVPSARVDQAVMRAIAARREAGTGKAPHRLYARSRRHEPFLGGSARMASWAAVAAAVLVIIVGSLTFMPGLRPTTNSRSVTTGAFALPANLSWSSEILYHMQTMTAKNGDQYQIKTYYTLAEHMLNVETTMGDRMDVVVVEDQQAHQALGMDMMHRVAQWDAQKWSVDESMFDLKQLRSDLQTGRARYLGKGTFQGQQVYRIRWSDNQILLLDMNYMPVNVLQAVGNSDTGQPEYTAVEWLKSSKVPESTWDMSVPRDFKLGALPAKPE